MAKAIFLKVVADETQILNKKMPVDIVVDENPDRFPKSQKIANSMQENRQSDFFRFLIDSCEEDP